MLGEQFVIANEPHFNAKWEGVCRGRVKSRLYPGLKGRQISLINLDAQGFDQVIRGRRLSLTSIGCFCLFVEIAKLFPL